MSYDVTLRPEWITVPDASGRVSRISRNHIAMMVQADELVLIHLVSGHVVVTRERWDSILAQLR